MNKKAKYDVVLGVIFLFELLLLILFAMLTEQYYCVRFFSQNTKKAHHLVGLFMAHLARLLGIKSLVLKDRLRRRSQAHRTSLREFFSHQVQKKPTIWWGFLWRTWRDSNSRPLPSEGNTLSS